MNDRQNELLTLLAERQKREAENRLSFYKPYPKQLMFHKLGATKRERALIAGTQLGKTYSASMEIAIHATGRYPEWWEGKRFSKPPRIWVTGETSAAIRDTSQKLLLGALRDGTGSIPKEAIADIRMGRGIPDAVEMIHVRHISGAISLIIFKAYEIGRARWQGDSVDLIWFDEEPPMDIYQEGLARTVATKGQVFCTFTPLRGRTDVVERFMSVPSDDREYITMTIDDAAHFTQAERERTIASYAPYEREARANGIPMQGSGLVYPIAQSAITFQLPNGSADAFLQMRPHLRKLIGIDLGVRFFAANLCAHDPEMDLFFVLDELLLEDQTAITQSAAIKMRWGDKIPVAFPHDALAREKGSGDNLASQYKAQGLNMMREHAQFPASEGGGYAVEPGISAILSRMQIGAFQIAESCAKTLEQLRQYHRKDDGKIVKARDHLCDSMRYAWVMRRNGRSDAELLSRQKRRQQGPIRAKGLDYDVYNYGKNQ